MLTCNYLVYRGLHPLRCLGVPKRRMLCRRRLCNRIATGGIKSARRVLQSYLGGVQVRTRLRDVRVSEHVRDVMQGPARLQEPTPGLVAQVVERPLIHCSLISLSL